MLSNKVSHGLGLRDSWLNLWGCAVPDKVLLDTLLPEALGTLKNVSISFSSDVFDGLHDDFMKTQESHGAFSLVLAQ